ncbi:MAG: hypothetical protein M0040_02505 [Actinomycetota bacterium]|nr:hypothetical protein [Actinomycetota bacterium]
MRRRTVERRLRTLGARLAAARAELELLDQQRAVLDDQADEAHLDALVSESPMAVREDAEARRHAEALARTRRDLEATIAELERRQAELLWQLT